MKYLNKRWFYLFVLAYLAITLACGASSSLTGNGQNDINTNDASTTINVVVDDFSFTLDTLETGAGTVTFVILNNGAMPHDFAIRGEHVVQKTPMIKSGDSATLTVELEPGTYTYFCTIAGHEQLGMSGTFTVTSS